MIALAVFDLQTDKQKMRTSRKKSKSENSRKVISKDVVYFKIMKLVYNKSMNLILK